MTIYEIDGRLEEVFTQLVDPETGEVLSDDPKLFEELDALQMARDQKIESVGCWVKDLRAEAEAIANEVKALQTRKKTAENKMESLKRYLSYALQGKKFKTAKCSISYSTSHPLEVTVSWQEIPEKYLRYSEPEINKTAIKEAINAGEKVKGCTIADKKNIVIR